MAESNLEARTGAERARRRPLLPAYTVGIALAVAVGSILAAVDLRLQSQKFPDRASHYFEQADSNGDGAITHDEWNRFYTNTLKNELKY